MSSSASTPASPSSMGAPGGAGRRSSAMHDLLTVFRRKSTFGVPRRSIYHAPVPSASGRSRSGASAKDVEMGLFTRRDSLQYGGKGASGKVLKCRKGSSGRVLIPERVKWIR